MADEELVRLAREALREITPEKTVGELLGQSAEEDGVITLTFGTTMPGYPGWHWTVSLAHLPGEDPTVLEAELLPGDGALLAPDWVPWSERLEEYRAAQAAAAAEAEAEGASDDDPEDDSDDEDEGDDAGEFDVDDDFGDDPDDGIDFESDDSAAPAAEPVGVDESDEAETEADEAGPEVPDASGLDERSDEEQ